MDSEVCWASGSQREIKNWNYAESKKQRRDQKQEGFV